MVTVGKMKSHLVELENERIRLQEEIQMAERRLKLSLGGLGIGVLLLPFVLLAGIPVLLVAGMIAVYYSFKKANYKDKLETLESEIHKLEISMA